MHIYLQCISRFWADFLLATHFFTWVHTYLHFAVFHAISHFMLISPFRISLLQRTCFEPDSFSLHISQHFSLSFTFLHLRRTQAKAHYVPFGWTNFAQHYVIVPKPVIFPLGGAPCNSSWPTSCTHYALTSQIKRADLSSDDNTRHTTYA